jgi:hypothetical protein
MCWTVVSIYIHPRQGIEMRIFVVHSKKKILFDNCHLIFYTEQGKRQSFCE